MIKSKQLSFVGDRHNVILTKGNKIQLGLFKETIAVSFNGRVKKAGPLDIIKVSKEIYDKYHTEKLCLINVSKGKQLNVTLLADATILGNEFLAVSFVVATLNLERDDEVRLCSYKDMVFDNVAQQIISNIREDKLILSNEDFACLTNSEMFKSCKLFEVYNAVEKTSIIVKKNHIEADPSIESGTIRLNRKQRTWLGIEAPARINEEQWSLIMSDRCSLEEKTFIKSIYNTDDHVMGGDAGFNACKKIKNIINRCCGLELHLIPVIETCFQKNRYRILKKLCDFYVGKSTISLMAQRPLENDEGQNIVRMTKSNMNLLGIDEMDKVIVQYKNNRIRCRVLEWEDKEDFYKTNLPNSPDLSIGIPVNIRKQLGIVDITTAVKIDRDTAFIFKKSLNEQILPILLTLLSANLFVDKSIIISVIFSVVAIPIVLYFNLSSKRNMRA